MFEGKPIIGAARQVAAICLATVIIAVGPLYAAHAAQSKGGKAAASEEGATSPAVAEFIALLADPIHSRVAPSWRSCLAKMPASVSKVI